MMGASTTNQPTHLTGFNAYDDAVLSEALKGDDLGWAEPRLRRMGALVGSVQVQEAARQANRHLPELHTRDRVGNRVDRVEFHPAYHQLMDLAFGGEVHSLAWTERRPGAHVARAALSFLWNQIENGVACPVGMAFGSVVALRQHPELAREWLPKLLSASYDPRPVPVTEKTAVTIGQTLTERQGGSDLRATTTRATRIPGTSDEYELTGEKWFCSAPMSDAFFTLAVTAGGISCFFVPRVVADGSRGGLLFHRLKDKCGNRSNATAELSFERAWARLVGEEGHGIGTMVSMSHLTRFDFAVGSAGLMRQTVLQTVHRATRRRAFGHAIAELPLMTNVLTDLALETEAAVALAFRVARAFDRAEEDPAEGLLARLATPLAKYWICKRTPAVVEEALQCWGGDGYVEESLVPRLYREAPLNAIWEGSANVVCLDVLRVLSRHQEAREVYLAEVKGARGTDRRLDRFVTGVEEEMTRALREEARCRRLVERMAVALQGSLLVRQAPAEVADAFCASRLEGDWGHAFGTLAPGAGHERILERARVPAHVGREAV